MIYDNPISEYECTDPNVNITYDTDVYIKFFKNPMRLKDLNIGDIFYKSWGLFSILSKELNEKDKIINIFCLHLSLDIGDGNEFEEYVPPTENRGLSIMVDSLSDEDDENSHFVLVVSDINISI